MIRSPLRKLKDAALEKAVLVFARSRFERYGELRWLNVDTAGKVLSAEVVLKGESEPVTVSQAKYRLESKGAQKLLVLYEIKVSTMQFNMLGTPKKKILFCRYFETGRRRERTRMFHEISRRY